MTTIAKVNCWLVVIITGTCWYFDPGPSAVVATVWAFFFVTLQLVIRNLLRRLHRYERPPCRTKVTHTTNPYNNERKDHV